VSENVILALPLDRVTVGARLRPVDADYVALLAASMEATGQHTPVDVGPADADGRHPLIAGAHRHAAALAAGLPSLLARVFEGSEDECKLLEIDENLMRRELSELDRAVFLVERKAIYERLHPDAKRGGNRAKDQTEENFRLAPRQESFASATATKLGISDRQVRTYIARARIVARVPELREALARSRWADNGAVLDELARVEAVDDLRALIGTLLRAEKPPANIRAAQLELGLIREAVASPDDVELHRMREAWRKSGARARRQFLAGLLADPAQRRLVTAAMGDVEDAVEARQQRVLDAVAGGHA